MWLTGGGLSRVAAIGPLLLAMAGTATIGLAEEEGTVPFDSPRWSLVNAKIVEHRGRPALAGTAFVKDAEFEDGIIEFDLAVTGARSYPGVVFRSHPDGSWERFYIRPHRAGSVPPPLYPDVLQYVPAWNRLDSWQLYSGPGYTAPAEIPVGRWFHVKVEVLGTQARVFLDNAPTPALLIHELSHGVRRGGIGFMGPADGTAYCSNFSFRKDDALRFDPPPRREFAPGFVRDWQLSQALPALRVDLDEPLSRQMSSLQWTAAQADARGLVDVARHRSRGVGPEIVYAKTSIHADRDGLRPFRIGYSDIARVFLNGISVFEGESVYQGRDPSFLGIVALSDTVYLPLRTGDNEIVIALIETMGGWGFTLQDGTAEYAAPGLIRGFKTGKVFALPESAAYDPATRRVYVSNYEGYNPSGTEGRQSIMAMPVDGRGEPSPWVTGLRNPTGLAVAGGILFAVEPTALVEIDIGQARISRRETVPGAIRLNDVAVGPDGTLYVSDSAQSVIYRRREDGWDAWLRGADVARPNGVCVSGERLVWGNNGDGALKAADLASGKVAVIADLPGGVIDGVANDPQGGWLVSHNEGRLYGVDPSGSITKLLDLTVTETGIADFTYVPETSQVVFPTFIDNRVMAFTLADRPAR